MTESGSSTTRNAANATELLFPSFGPETGVHVNITGAALAAHSQNADLALQFIEFLLTPEGQALLVDETKEIPVIEETERPAGLERIPAFEESDMRLSAFGENQAAAQRIYDGAGWN
jgi:iron(III) transport system substrate-binding protein